MRGLRFWDFRDYGFEFPIYDFSISAMVLNAKKNQLQLDRRLGDEGSGQLGFSFYFILIPIRFHFYFTSMPRRLHFYVTSMSLRLRSAPHSISLRYHFEFVQIPFRFHFELTSMPHSTTRPRGQALSNEQSETKQSPGCIHPTPSDVGSSVSKLH